MTDSASPKTFPDTVLITGATGLVGRALVEKIQRRSPRTQIRILTRSHPAEFEAHPSVRFQAFQWTPSSQKMDESAVAGVDCVIHLAGETVAQRWSQDASARIRSSRIDALELITQACQNQSVAPRVISASAIGGYPSSAATQDEQTNLGSGFIEDVVRDWENAAARLGALGGGHVNLRIGLVLSPQGGVLSRLLPLYKCGLGSPLSPGDQWQSWIHIDDLTDLFLHAARHLQWSGPYNAVSPKPVAQKDFSQALAKTLDRPHFLPAVPQWALRLLFGEAAHALLASHRINPTRTVDSGFDFSHPNLLPALEDLLHSNQNSTP